MLKRLILIALILMPMTAAAQLATPGTIHLGAVSIKENRSGAEQGYLSIPPNGDRITVTNSPMFRIVGFAFNKRRNDLIEGLPDWTRELRWDIEATISEESLPVFHRMPFERQTEVLQQVLRQRCGLVAQMGMKEVPVYALTVLKSGPKIKEVPPAPADSRSSGWDITENPGEIHGRAIPMEALLYALSKAGLERQVVDRTGLTGRYDIDLTWAPEEKALGSPDSGEAEQSTKPSIFTAVQEELGLKLKATRANVEALIVSHIDKPSAN